MKDNPEIKHGSYKKYKNKKLIEEGFYKENKKDSTWNIYSQKGYLVASGNYISDSVTGVWNFFSLSNVLVQKYDYEHDSLLYFDINEEKKIGSPPATFPDTAQEQIPIFIGGTAFMFAMIENNMVYPEAALAKSKNANVYVSFEVDTVGNTTNVKSIRPVGDGFDEEAVRLVELFGKSWIPGVQSGKKVRVTYTLPLRFKVQ